MSAVTLTPSPAVSTIDVPLLYGDFDLAVFSVHVPSIGSGDWARGAAPARATTAMAVSRVFTVTNALWAREGRRPGLGRRQSLTAAAGPVRSLPAGLRRERPSPPQP